FTWEGPNDTKLLLLTQGRYVKPEEYETLSSAFPGTTTGSIRNRISALRVKQRNLYEGLGWDVPEGGAGHSAKKSGKRGGSEEERGMETPSKKKPRVAKTKGKKEEEEEVKSEAGRLDGGLGWGVGVKEEVVEDE
ncbi:hypothetical protein BDU57DRAFT_429868, partial [Ampelomyces quisqualis]